MPAQDRVRGDQAVATQCAGQPLDEGEDEEKDQGGGDDEGEDQGDEDREEEAQAA